MLSMEDLPWHVLDETFGYLGDADVRTCRVVCRAWDGVIGRKPIASICIGGARHGLRKYGGSVRRAIVSSATPAKVLPLIKHCRRLRELEIVAIDEDMDLQEEAELAALLAEARAKHVTIFSQDILNDGAVLALGNLTSLSSNRRYSHREMRAFLESADMPSLRALELDFEALDNSLCLALAIKFGRLRRVALTCLFPTLGVDYLLFPPVPTLWEVDVALRISSVRTLHYPDLGCALIRKAHFKSEGHVCFVPTGRPIFEATTAVSLDWEIALHAPFHAVFPRALRLALTSTPQTTVPRALLHGPSALTALAFTAFGSEWEAIGLQPSITRVTLDMAGHTTTPLRWLTVGLPNLRFLMLHQWEASAWANELKPPTMFPSLIIFASSSPLPPSSCRALAQVAPQLRLIRAPRQPAVAGFPRLDFEEA